MGVLARATRLLGDPVIAAAATVGLFLVLSGLGSLAVDRRPALAASRGRPAFVAIVALSLVALVPGPWLPPALRDAAALAAVAPLAFFMGCPMPAALARLGRGAAPVIPWAWGVNGFASVLSAPLATLLAMAWGFTTAAALAAALYATAALLFGRLPGAARDPG